MSEWVEHWTCNLGDSPVAEVGKLSFPSPHGSEKV